MTKTSVSETFHKIFIKDGGNVCRQNISFKNLITCQSLQALKSYGHGITKLCPVTVLNAR